MSRNGARRRNRPAVEGAHNLRDLGGLQTADGRVVRYRRAFRSGTLSGLTKAGRAAIRSLGIGTIFDFRSGPERDHDPCSALGEPPPRLWQLAPSASLGDPKPLLTRCLQSAEETRKVMCENYRTLPFAHREPFAAMFRCLAQEETPVLFHCSAGKDRTGVASALLLSLLGVQRSQIYTDYLKTNESIEITTRTFLSDPRNGIAKTVRASVWRPMMEADGRYLDAMFAAVQQSCGSVEGYARKVMGLTRRQVINLQRFLLE